MPSDRCPECGYPVVDGTHYRGFYSPDHPCDHCGYGPAEGIADKAEGAPRTLLDRMVDVYCESLVAAAAEKIAEGLAEWAASEGQRLPAMTREDLVGLVNHPGRGHCRSCGADYRDPSIYCWECEAHHYAKRTQELKRWAFWLGTLSLLELAGLWWMATHLP